MLDVQSWPEGEVGAMAVEIDRLNLQREVYELELYGFTVVPAARTGAVSLCQQALQRVHDLVQERTGVRPDEQEGSTHADVVTPTLYHFIHEDQVFRDLLTHPMALALATVLVGHRGIVSASTVFMKGPASHDTGNALGLGARGTGLQLGLHSDNTGMPEPFPFFAQLCNVTWLLSDYTKADGALAIVPGSHRLCRQPVRDEAVEAAVAIEAPAGSLVVWHGNTWHGSYPRTRPGLRTGLAFALAREHLHPLEPVRRDVTPEMVEASGERFARLVGGEVIEWGTEGPDYDRLLRRPFRFTVYT